MEETGILRRMEREQWPRPLMRNRMGAQDQHRSHGKGEMHFRVMTPVHAYDKKKEEEGTISSSSIIYSRGRFFFFCEDSYDSFRSFFLR